MTQTCYFLNIVHYKTLSKEVLFNFILLLVRTENFIGQKLKVANKATHLSKLLLLKLSTIDNDDSVNYIMWIVTYTYIFIQIIMYSFKKYIIIF